jgi:hypothetical protein
MEYGYCLRRKKKVLSIHGHEQEALKHSRVR